MDNDKIPQPTTPRSASISGGSELHAPPMADQDLGLLDETSATPALTAEEIAAKIAYLEGLGATALREEEAKTYGGADLLALLDEILQEDSVPSAKNRENAAAQDATVDRFAATLDFLLGTISSVGSDTFNVENLAGYLRTRGVPEKDLSPRKLQNFIRSNTAQFVEEAGKSHGVNARLVTFDGVYAFAPVVSPVSPEHTAEPELDESVISPVETSEIVPVVDRSEVDKRPSKVELNLAQRQILAYISQLDAPQRINSVVTEIVGRRSSSLNPEDVKRTLAELADLELVYMQRVGGRYKVSSKPFPQETTGQPGLVDRGEKVKSQNRVKFKTILDVVQVLTSSQIHPDSALEPIEVWRMIHINSESVPIMSDQQALEIKMAGRKLASIGVARAGQAPQQSKGARGSSRVMVFKIGIRSHRVKKELVEMSKEGRINHIREMLQTTDTKDEIEY